MKIQRNKIYLLLLFFSIMIISVSAVSAEDINDNSTADSQISDNSETNISVSGSTSNSEDILDQSRNISGDLGVTDNDSDSQYSKTVYFDSNVLDDTGDGTINSPYKTITSTRINGNLAIITNGNYVISGNFYLTSPTKIVGSSALDTILKFSGNTVRSDNYLKLVNLTVSNVNFYNRGELFAYNVLFANTTDYSDNNFGGVIYSIGDVGIYNSTFLSLGSEYAGAIYQTLGNLDIVNSTFINISSSNFGGAIAINASNLKISNSQFNNVVSTGDAGAAIYSTCSNIVIDQTSFTNCSSTFGTICQLEGNLNISNSNFTNNSAKYYGGAIYDMYGPIDVTNCRFFYNTALNGGAISIDNTTASIKNSKFKNNNATYYGGAIYACIVKEFISSNNEFEDNYALVNNTIYNITEVPMYYGNQNYTIIVMDNTTINGSLPSKFDLRDYGYVTSIKDQASGGNCWAFAILSALESNILKANGKTYDFSEENMKNLMAYYSDYGWLYYGIKVTPNDGGIDNMAIGYLVSWLGPISEDLDSYDDYSGISAALNSSLVHVQNVYFIPARENYLDNDKIKSAIVNYGVVSTSMYYSSYYLTGNSYYYSGTPGSNHAVSIVGWDDNYSASNFGYYSHPAGNGAWIVKNSWGESWGDDGYFYVSYYDTAFACVGTQDTYVFILNDTARYNKIYQYDMSGFTDWFVTSRSSIWYENIFKAVDNDTLAAFSTYFENAGTNYEVYVLVNNQTVSSQSGTVSVPGYSTIHLDNPVMLHEGDNFTIRIKLSGSGNVNFPIIENSTVRVNLKENVSYFSFDGSNWVDLSTYVNSGDSSTDGHYYAGQIACIKAFTVGNLKSTVIANDVLMNYNDGTKLAIQVLDEDNQPLANSYVDISMDNINYYRLTDSNGYVYFDLNQNPGIYSVNIRFNGNLDYSPSIKNVTVSIRPKININASSVVKYYGDDSNLIINLTYENGTPVTNQEVLVNISSNHYTLTTNEYGIAVLNITDKIGSYNAVIYLDNQSTYYYYDNPVNVTIEVLVNQVNLEVSDLVKYYKDSSSLIITLTDKDGKPVSGENIYLTIGGTNYVVVSNENGTALLNLNNTPGNYVGTVYINNSNYYANPVNFSLIVLKGKVAINESDLVMSYKDGSRFGATFLDNEGNPLSNLSVVFEVCGKNYTRTTDDDGYASLAINLNVGNYTVNTFVNDGYFEFVLTSNNVVVNKRDIVFENVSTNLVMYYKDGSKLQARLLDQDGNPASNVNLTFEICGKKYYRITDSDGFASLNINLNVGKYAFKIYLPSKSYNAQTITSTVTVKKMPAKINLISTNIKKGNYLNVRILDRNNKPISQVKVAIRISGKTYYKVTDSNGYVKLKINLSPKYYSTNISIVNTRNFQSSSLTNTIKVNK